MGFTTEMLGAVIGLFTAMMLLFRVGARIRHRQIEREHGISHAGAAETSVFALLGLLVAFTFSGALSRFDLRRQYIAAETNAISTAYVLIDVLPEDRQAELRELFRRYVESRLATTHDATDTGHIAQRIGTSQAIQREIWAKAVAALRAQGDPPIAGTVLSAINAMMDIMITRAVAASMHPPLIIFVLLFALALVCALLSGHATGASPGWHWVPMLAFATVMSVTVFVIVDIEHPRHGLIRIDGTDRVLLDLRHSMK